MAHNILITGGSGYLGGTLLARWKEANLPPHGKVFALVRSQHQEEAVKQYNAEPISINFDDAGALETAIIDNDISIVFHLFNPTDTEYSVAFIKALSEVKKRTGKEVHFVFTTGAKIFSNHVAAPTDKPLLDTDPALFEIQKNMENKGPHPRFNQAVKANNIVIETAEQYGVRSYIFAPCIVYGKGEGFGNPISIQTVAIVQAAKALRQVYKVDAGRPTWPVCHVLDNTGLYLQILRKILSGEEIGHGRSGYYLASPGSIAWDDLYLAIAKAMKQRNAVDDISVKEADDDILGKMGDALKCPKDFVAVQVGGLCTFTAENGKRIGWKPRYEPQHILETADEEVELILKHLKD
ncbi:NAD(P)-binding protein [Aaosphaeria arxii CBS 175.79]|uniref:NAD(P)-binding protein n=1 Tax=Aaosphaeria arxii CBS 175.79 TaxID=1450172 RepID=A0A6A5XL10_9PLEO|nr:NAD(P)-binding protein [Aaosphaeria arxii CBS 175.79]KAF2013576.1 NAD(P)-binding protein [Aaosphaeria arxii CBS 175.79]